MRSSLLRTVSVIPAEPRLDWHAAARCRFKADEEAVELANATEYGLAAYFYSRDLARIWRVAQRLEYGMVGINETLLVSEAAPFGGVKQSGLGREHGRRGIDAFVEEKLLCFATS